MMPRIFKNSNFFLRRFLAIICYQIVFLVSCSTSTTNFTTNSTNNSTETTKSHLLVYNPEELFKQVPFIKNTKETSPFSAYLMMNVNYAPVEKIRKSLESSLKMLKMLKNRGEAHITVITPVEYQKSLKSFISIELIHEIAELHKIQESSFHVVCIGKGSARGQDQDLVTFFIVVTSENLLKIRQEVKKIFVAKGGNPNDFDAEDFYPHITLGFNERDLHIQDGVIKNSRSCTYPLTPMTPERTPNVTRAIMNDNGNSMAEAL